MPAVVDCRGDVGRHTQAPKSTLNGPEAEPEAQSRHLRNRFNFNDRAAQTFNYPPCDRGMLTEPPASATFSGTRSPHI
jgi:hypothetical protein